MALPPLQLRRRNKATMSADKAQNVTSFISNQTLDQNTSPAQRAARRASWGKGQRTLEANSAETPTADAYRDNQERADTEHVTKPELNNTAWNSGASEATQLRLGRRGAGRPWTPQIPNKRLKKIETKKRNTDIR